MNHNFGAVFLRVSLSSMLRFYTATGVWKTMGVIPKLAAAFCLCDWIISITYLVSSGYLSMKDFLSSSSLNTSQKVMNT